MLKVLGLFVLTFFIIAIGGGCELINTEETCWKNEATEAFQKYGSLKTRSDILRVVGTLEILGVDGTEIDPKSNPVEIVVKDPNACSLGSNGRTVLRLYFDDRNKLTKIQVLRDYIASGSKMGLIEERKF
jgi:hypothetical protein